MLSIHSFLDRFIFYSFQFPLKKQKMNFKLTILFSLFLLLLSTTTIVAPAQFKYQFYEKIGPDQIDFLINSIDRKPKDGCVSVEEIDNFLETDYKIVMDYFPKADKNGDGKVDVLERSKLLKNFLDFDLSENLAVPIELMAEKMVEKVIKMEAVKKGEVPPIVNFEDIQKSQLFYQIAQFYEENEDGSFTKEQFEDIPANFEKLKQFVREADENGDGDGKADRQEMLDLWLDSVEEKESGKKWEL